MDGPVTHQDQRVPFSHLKTVFIDFFIPDNPGVSWYGNQAPIPDEDTAGIIKLHQIGFTVMKHLKDAEGRIGYLAHLTYRKGLHNGFHTLFQGRTV